MQVLLPPGFSFSDGWQAPPSGAIFDLGEDLEGLALAQAGDTAPAGPWQLDFFLPAAISAGPMTTVDLARGFTAVAYMGAVAGSVADWAATWTPA